MELLKGFSAAGQPMLGSCIGSIYPTIRLCDMGINLLDGMYRGEYHGKQAHDSDLPFVIDRARSLGVRSMIITAGNLQETRDSISFCREYPDNSGLYCTAGVHPTRSSEFKGREDEVSDELERLIADGVSTGTVVAIGECGLDYDRLHFSSKAQQLVGFQRQLDIADKFSLPMFLHDRNTDGEFLRMVTAQRDKMKGGGVVHSFTGTTAEMDAFTSLGLFIGINGCSLKTLEGLQNAAAVPAHLLLLETDGPWCGIKRTHASNAHITSTFPALKKDKFTEGVMVKDRNEPCTMIQVLEVVAKVRNCDPVELAEQVYANSERLFPLIKR